MKKLLLSLAILMSPLALARELPSLTEKPFVGFWIGYAEDDFDFGIGGDGDSQLFIKKKVKREMERISPLRTLKVHYLVQEKVGGKWLNRSREDGGYETDIEASDEAESVEWTATYKGGTTVKINHTFDGERIHTRIAQISTQSKKPIRVAVEVVFPDLYRLRSSLDARAIKKKLDRDEIRATRLDEKSFKFKLHQDVQLSDEEILGQGAVEYSLESKQLADLKIALSCVGKGNGKILLEHRGPLHSPVSAIWYPETPESALVIEVD